MRFVKQIRLLAFLSTTLLVLHVPVTTGAQSKNVLGSQRERLSIPVGIYILDSAGGNDHLSSQRTVEDIHSIFKEANNIWSQADIGIEAVQIERVSVPQDTLWSIIHRTGRGGIGDFFSAIRRGEVEFKDTNNGALVWALFVRSMGGINGLAPIGSATFFVADDSTVADARVTSHEIGHVLGLYHARDDQARLLFSGTNGVVLTQEEQAVARYNARRILQK